ncbi:MAG: sigma-70 family RNA polymerase sigma factor, partial [Myxococcota bacterium]
ASWFRRIVRKHCDRETRRARPTWVPLDLVQESPAEEPSPEEELVDSRARASLRATLGLLPPAERLPVALHYLAGATQPEIAAFLELPLSTVKKRLRVARDHLRRKGRDIMTEQRIALKSDGREEFSDLVQFFLALRSGDCVSVERFLDDCPSLLEAEQNWDFEWVEKGELPVPNRATPVIVAIERDDAPMVELLLSRGASPDGPCGCVTGETPLWTAAVFGRLGMARRLLRGGASVGVKTLAGTTALHVAAMRGHVEMVILLVKSGADPKSRDMHGRTPLDWALLKGHTDVITQLEPGGDRSASAPAVEPFTDSQTFYSGIKAVDFFVPLPLGALLRFPFAAGVGLVVLLAELSHRFSLDARREVIWTGFASRALDAQDLEAGLTETGLRDRVSIFVAAFDEPLDARRAAFEQGLREAEVARTAGRPVLVVIFSAARDQAEVDSVLLRLSEKTPNRITAVVVTPPDASSVEVWPTLQPPFDAQLVLDPLRARRALFPALDPLHSFSSRRSQDRTNEREDRLVADVRDYLVRYQEIDPELLLPNPSTLPEEARTLARVGQSLLRFFAQPFHIAEPFTAQPGSEFSREDLFDEIEELIVAASATSNRE